MRTLSTPSPGGRRSTLVVCVAASWALAVGAIVAPGASAVGCLRHRVTIISRTGPASAPPTEGLQSADYDRLYCSGLPSSGPDLRVIPVGATWVQVRTLGAAYPGRASLSGLISRTGLPMQFEPSPVPGRLNDEWKSAWIPLDPRARGAVTVRVDFDSNTYRTALR